MKNLALIVTSASLVAFLSACSPPAADETADDFIARANSELKDLRKEVGAANWEWRTNITEDTAAASELANEH